MVINLTINDLLPTIFRDEGNAHLVELLENARRSRKSSTSAAQARGAAAGPSAVDGAAALDKAGANPAGSIAMVDGAAAVGGAPSAVAAALDIEDLRKCCWKCKTPAEEDNLCLCSGCRKVRTLKV